jgi:hypothetical protein
MGALSNQTEMHVSANLPAVIYVGQIRPTRQAGQTWVGHFQPPLVPASPGSVHKYHLENFLLERDCHMRFLEIILACINSCRPAKNLHRFVHYNYFYSQNLIKWGAWSKLPAKVSLHILTDKRWKTLPKSTRPNVIYLLAFRTASRWKS